MAIGLTSKLFIIMIVINTVVAFGGSTMIYDSTEQVKTMSDHIDDLQTATQNVDKDIGGTSGINILEYFNPLNYGWVADGISLIGGYFIDPIIMFGTLPAPFGTMFSAIYGALQIFAGLGLIRGFAV